MSVNITSKMNTDYKQKLLRNTLRNAKSGNFQPLKTILTENKHKINFTDLVYAHSGDSILHIAAALGTPSDIQFILNHFNNIVNYKNKDDKTPLHEACQFSRSDNVKILIDNGADVNAIKRADWTPLMLVCAKTQHEDSVTIVNLLLEKGALVNLFNKDGWNALHLVARDGNVDVFNVLLENRSNLNAVTKNGRTVLHIAALHGKTAIVKCILKESPGSVNIRDNCGNTPLHEAVLGGHVTLCNLLIENGAEINLKNFIDYDVLHLAASVDCLEMIRYLVDQVKCDVDSIANNGLRPLHCAARNNNKNVYMMLVAFGADEGAKDSFGRIAKDYFISGN